MLEQTRTDEEKSKAEDRLLRRQDAKKRKLAELGIDYDMGDAEYVSPPCRVQIHTHTHRNCRRRRGRRCRRWHEAQDGQRCECMRIHHAGSSCTRWMPELRYIGTSAVCQGTEETHSWGRKHGGLCRQRLGFECMRVHYANSGCT
jgi:hypothetical protein